MHGNVDRQRALASLLLAHTGEHGFALAGSSALREHGLTDRPTEDIDLFNGRFELPPERFAAAVDEVARALTADGWQVEFLRSAPTYQRLSVEKDGFRCDIDMGVDHRSHEPVVLEVGPVLAVEDAVANKIAAMFSRRYPRDYVDVDSIRRTGRWTDRQLVELGQQSDLGCTEGALIDTLRAAPVILGTPELVSDYGLSPDEITAIATRLARWGEDLQHQVTAHG